MSDPNKDGLEEIEILPTTKIKGTGGPLSSLEQNKYFVNDAGELKYPIDLKTNRYPHYIRFNINQKTESRYTKENIFETSSIQSQSDTNKIRYGQTINTGGQVGVAAGVLWAGQEVIGDIASQSKNFSGVSGTINSGIGTAVGATAVGYIADSIYSNIKLTRQTKRLLQTIELYIPDQVVMQTQNQYGKISLTKALGLAGLASQAGGSITSAFETYKNNLPNFSSAVAEAVLDPKKPATDFLNASQGFVDEILKSPAGNEFKAGVLGGAGQKLGVFGEGIENVILQSFGYAQNPQIEILFETTDVRGFEFTFNFLPRNEDESDQVAKIIRMFRFHSAPEIEKTSGGRFFIPPSEFDIEYRFKGPDGDTLNEALHRFSTCVLEAMSVNYVGQSGQFVTFKDGRPVNIEVVLRFKEVEVIHKDLVKAGY